MSSVSSFFRVLIQLFAKTNVVAMERNHSMRFNENWEKGHYQNIDFVTNVVQ